MNLWLLSKAVEPIGQNDELLKFIFFSVSELLFELLLFSLVGPIFIQL